MRSCSRPGLDRRDDLPGPYAISRFAMAVRRGRPRSAPLARDPATPARGLPGARRVGAARAARGLMKLGPERTAPRSPNWGDHRAAANRGMKLLLGALSGPDLTVG